MPLLPPVIGAIVPSSLATYFSLSLRIFVSFRNPS
jgi:hypothetical protein